MNDLLLPISLVEELAEERAKALQRQESVNLPLSFFTTFRGTQVGLGTEIRQDKLLEEQKGWSAIALRPIVDRIGELEWFAAERAGMDDKGKPIFEPVPDHILSELVMRPNPIMDGAQLRMLLAAWLKQVGEGYIQKLRDPFGIVRELWPIPVQNIEPVSANNMVIGAYRVRTASNRQITVPIEDVIRVWRPSPRTIYSALGDLAPQAVEWDAFRFMDEHLRAYFENDATPRVAIVADSDTQLPEPEERDAFNATWRNANNWRRGTQVGLPAFLPPGFKPHEFNSELGTTDMIAHGDQWSDQIMSAYGVPKFTVGKDTNVNRATAETTMWAFDKLTVKPMTDLITRAMTIQLAQAEFDDSLAVLFPAFVAPDKQFEQSQEDQDLRLGVRSVQQVRRDRNLDPEGAPWGEKPILPFSLEPYTGEESSVLDAPRARISRRSSTSPTAGGFFSPDRTFERNEQVIRRFAPRWARTMQKVFEEQRRATLVELANATGTDVSALLKSMAGGTARERRKARRMRVSLTVDEIFQGTTWQALFDDVIEPLRQEILTGSAEISLAALNADKNFNLTSTMTEALRNQGAQYVTNINGTTQARIAEMLAEAAQAGDSVDQIARRIDAIFRDKARSRAIARTEVGMANQSGTTEGFRLSEVVEEKAWNTSRDSAVRDSHAIDGQTVRLDQLFELRSGTRAEFPLDPRLPPADLVNCRCFVTPLVQGE